MHFTQERTKIISELTGADLFKIEQAVPYSAKYDTCIAEAKKDLQTKARPKLVSLPESIDKYDEIYLGYPNYWGDMPMAVYTFLEAFDWNGKTIHPFCTHEGSGLSGTEGKIKSTCKGAVVEKGLAVQGTVAQSDSSAVKDLLQDSGIIG